MARILDFVSGRWEGWGYVFFFLPEVADFNIFLNYNKLNVLLFVTIVLELLLSPSPSHHASGKRTLPKLYKILIYFHHPYPPRLPFPPKRPCNILCGVPDFDDENTIFFACHNKSVAVTTVRVYMKTKKEKKHHDRGDVVTAAGSTVKNIRLSFPPPRPAVSRGFSKIPSGHPASPGRWRNGHRGGRAIFAAGPGERARRKCI